MQPPKPDARRTVHHIDSLPHIALCGATVPTLRSFALPWPDWIGTYATRPDACCTACRRAALRYAPYSQPIRTADLQRKRSTQP